MSVRLDSDSYFAHFKKTDKYAYVVDDVVDLNFAGSFFRSC